MPDKTEPTRSLHRKLAQVMYEAERIPKNGTAPREMGGYPFVQVGDAADYIRKALAEKIITMMPTAVHVVGQQDRPTKSGGNMTTVDLVTEWTLTDGESGESITIMSFGSGADGGDKYSGKASTSAMKYALLTGFLLSTGEDSEGSKMPEQRSIAEGFAPAPPKPDPVRVLTRADEPELVGSWSGTGAIGVKKTGTADGLLRESPEGAVVVCTFTTTDEQKVPQIIFRGSLALDVLDAAGSDLNGLVCTVEGEMYRVPFYVGPQKDIPRPFDRLEVKRIHTTSWTLPEPEPETLPLGLDAELDGILEKVP